jgi:hypothetical protein
VAGHVDRRFSGFGLSVMSSQTERVRRADKLIRTEKKRVCDRYKQFATYTSQIQDILQGKLLHEPLLAPLLHLNKSLYM